MTDTEEQDKSGEWCIDVYYPEKERYTIKADSCDEAIDIAKQNYADKHEVDIGYVDWNFYHGNNKPPAE